MQELPEPRQTGPDPLPHMRRETPGVQAAQRDQPKDAGKTSGHKRKIGDTNSHATRCERIHPGSGYKLQ